MSLELPISEVRRHLGEQYAFDKGDFLVQGTGGLATRVSLLKRKGTTPTPFFVSSNYTKAWVYPGTINSYFPVIGADSITTVPAPQLTLASGDQNVVIHIAVSITTDIDETYVAGWVKDQDPSFEIKVVTDDDLLLDPQVGTGGVVEFDIVLATFLDYKKTSQPVISSLWFNIEDDGTGTAAARLLVGAA